MLHRASKIASGLAVLAGLAGFVRAADEAQSKDCGWCVITCPKVVTTAVPFEVKVDLKELPGPTKLNIDLHCRKKDGSYGGFFAWGGGGKDVDKAGPQTKTFTVTSLKDDLGTINVSAFLSPDGQWGSMTTNAAGPDMELKTTEAFLRTVRPRDCTFKKSWICIEPPDPSKTIRAGEEFEVRITYYLDPSENWGDGTKLFLQTYGPWIDCPDGKYTKNRGHVSYPGLRGAAIQVAPGKGDRTFKFKAAAVYKYNGLLLLAYYQGGDGRNWPWETRAAGPHFVCEDKHYQLSNGKPGGLFTYDEPVKLQILFKEGAIKGESKMLRYRIFNTRGVEIASGEQPFTVGGKDDSVAFVPEIRERGTFVAEADVAGWGSRDVVFARIPDVMKLTGGGKTPFGATLLNSDAECQIARMLGFTTCRQFLDWRFVQPARDTWNVEA